jgi:hypothetical protein
MARVEKRWAGDYEFTLFVVGPEADGRWHWWLNRADSRQTNFGTTIARGATETKERAERAVQEAFEQHRALVKQQ